MRRARRYAAINTCIKVFFNKKMGIKFFLKVTEVAGGIAGFSSGTSSTDVVVVDVVRTRRPFLRVCQEVNIA